MISEVTKKDYLVVWIYRYWITVEGLCDEVGDDPAILEVHSGPICVEYPGDTHVDPFSISV